MLKLESGGSVTNGTTLSEPDNPKYKKKTKFNSSPRGTKK